MTKMEAEFWKFVCKRHQIYENRFVKKLPAPWTDDEILRKFKFTNVMRRLDRGTVYLVNNILNQNWKSQEIFAAIVAYRLLNRIVTWDYISRRIVDGKPDTECILEFFRALKSKGFRIFTSAYIVHPGNMRLKKLHPGNQKFERVIQVWEDLLSDGEYQYCKIQDIASLSTPAEQFRMLQKIPMVGKFTAYEIWCDLTYYSEKHNGRLIPFTENDFVNVGPGCHAGAKWIYGPDIKISEVEEKLTYLRDKQVEHINEIGLYFPMCEGSLVLRDIEHSMCEANKYFRTKFGKGQPKCYFTPMSATV